MFESFQRVFLCTCSGKTSCLLSVSELLSRLVLGLLSLSSVLVVEFNMRVQQLDGFDRRENFSLGGRGNTE